MAYRIRALRQKKTRKRARRRTITMMQLQMKGSIFSENSNLSPVS